MANEFYTLIVVPHARARFRKIQIRVRPARWIGTAMGLAGVVLIALMFVFLRQSWKIHEYHRLKAENQTLLTKTKEYEQNAGTLRAKLLSLENLVTKLGVMSGIEQVLPDSRVSGVGGVSSVESVAPSLETSLSFQEMDRNLSDLTDRSQRIKEFYKDQKVLLSSTPSVWPVRGYLSGGFGNRLDPFTAQRDFHPGIDISTPIGAKVQTPADGVVVFAAPKGGYGNAVIINHGYGIITRYAHLDGFNVRPGQRIRRGDVIGFVGNTGKSTAPHLHYEVWVRDQAQNPIHFILDEYRSFS